MKYNLFAVVFGLASVASIGAQASESLGAATLGRIDAALTICARADAQDRATFEKLRTQLIVFAEGTKDEIRAPGVGSPEYKAGYAEVIEASEKVQHEARQDMCQHMVAQNPKHDDN